MATITEEEFKAKGEVQLENGVGTIRYPIVNKGKSVLNKAIVVSVKEPVNKSTEFRLPNNQ